MSDKFDPSKIPELYFTEREYYALREVFGLVSTFDRCAGQLEKRLKLIPGAWRDYRMIQTVALKLIQMLLYTIPEKKKKQISAELHNTITEVTVKKPSITADMKSYYDDNLTYVSQLALERITRRCVEFDCIFCEKAGKEAKRCQLRQDIESTYHFELFTDFQKNRVCPFAGAYIYDPTKEVEDDE